MTIALLIGLVLVSGFGLASFRGAPYLRIRKKDSQSALDLMQLHAGDTFIDLGSGDGYMLRAAAKKGIYGIGYEINPVMVVISWLYCFKYRRLVSIKLADFWSAPLPQVKSVYTFLLPKYMTRLDEKLSREAKTPIRLVSYTFRIPHKQATQVAGHAYAYDYVPTTKQKAA